MPRFTSRANRNNPRLPPTPKKFLNSTSLAVADDMFWRLPFPDVVRMDKLHDRHGVQGEASTFLLNLQEDLNDARAAQDLRDGWERYLEVEKGVDMKKPAKTKNRARRMATPTTSDDEREKAQEVLSYVPLPCYHYPDTSLPRQDERFDNYGAAAAAAAGSPEVGPRSHTRCIYEFCPECPVQSESPRWAPNGRLESLILEPERALTLRELASVLVVTSQHSRLLNMLRTDELGISESRLLQDGKMTELFEWAFDLPTGSLGPGGSLGYSFKMSMLDHASGNATAAAHVLLQAARKELKGVAFARYELKGVTVVDRDPVSMRAIFRTMFRLLFQGAGHSPQSPGMDGLVQLGVDPVLTDALGKFSVHGGTVGQSVAAVGGVRDGVVYDARGHVAANAYQPKKPALVGQA